MFRVRGYIQILLSAQLLVGVWSWTASAIAEGGGNSTPTVQGTNSGPSTNTTLDLGSTTASIPVSALGGSASIIAADGSTLTFGGSSMLTPAQYIAALQSINGGSQTLNVALSGAATGGSFNLASASSLGSLVVPTGVVGLVDFGAQQTVNLTGSLMNSGSIYLLSSNQNITSGVLGAYNITNNQNALITSVLPSSASILGLQSLAGLVSNLSFTLSAVNNITNYGAIASAGSLNLTAGNSIVNSAINSSAMMGSISAMQNVSLLAANITNCGQITASLANINVQANNLVNSGLLQSTRGDINISNLVSNVLDVNNIGGFISAQDNLDFLNTNSSRSSQILLNGGILEAENISFNDRRGTVSVHVDDITSNVAFSARNVSLEVTDGSYGLNLTGLNKSRSVELSYNGVGNVNTTGFKTLGNDVNIITSGAINVSGNIVTAAKSGDAGSVLLTSGSSIATKQINANAKGNGDGGDIVLVSGGNVLTAALTAKGAGNGDGGAISIAAGGTLTTKAINTSASNNGDGGGVLLLAGSTLKTGAVNTTGGDESGGYVFIASGSSVKTGAITTAGVHDADGGNVTVFAGTTLQTGNVNTAGAGNGDGGNVILRSGTTLNTGDVIASGAGNGDGGNVSVSAGTTLTAQDIITVGGKSGDGGNIVLSSGKSLVADDLNASGGSSGNPGSITINGGTTGTGNVTVSNITDNGVSGGGSITITTPGQATVSNTISAVDGTVTVNSQTSNIGNIDVGSGKININPIGSGDQPVVIRLEDFANYGTANVVIGGAAGYSNDILISGNCNQCFGNVSSITVNTKGDYTATGTTLTLGNDQSFQVNAAGNVSTGTVIGGQSVGFTGGGVISVDGAITLPNGNLQLSGTGFDISAPVNVGGGTVSLLPIGSTTINGEQLSNITAGGLNIGNGQAAQNVTLTGNTDLSNISGQVNVNLGGNFDSSQASVQVGNASMIVNASNVTTGGINGGYAFVVNARESLTVTGDINVPLGPIVLNGDLNATGAQINLASGVDVTGTSISIMSPNGNITSGANLTSLNTEIAIYAGGSLNLLDDSTVTAHSDVSLRAVGDINLGSSGGSGISISAGSMATGVDPFQTNGTFKSSTVSAPGSVIIDGYMGGNGGGDLNIGDNVSISAIGNGSNGGNLGLTSGRDLNVGHNAKLGAFGGDLWLSAWGSIDVLSGSLIVSAATDSQEASGSYTGGKIAVIAGLPDTNATQLLNGLAATRTGAELQTAGYSLAGNTVSSTGGSLISLVFDDKDVKTLSGNNIQLNGGVLYLDPPPDPTIPHTVTITGTQINVFGPQLAAPVIPGGGVVGGGANNGNTGSVVTIPTIPTTPTIPSGAGGNATTLPTIPVVNGGTIPGGTQGSFLGGVLPSSVVNANDTTVRSAGLTSQQTVVGVYSGSSAVPSDTLDDDTTQPNPKQALFCSKPQLLKAKDEVDEDSWIIASGGCEPFSFEEHDGSLIVGSGPAKMAPSSDRTLLIKEGKILVITVDRIHVIRTPLCNITIPVNTATVVEVDAKMGLVRIADLAGGKTSVTICRNDETFILSAAPGEQLVLAESNVPDANFSGFTVPNVDHEKVASWQLEMSGLRGQKMKFDRNAMAVQETLVNCSRGCVNAVQNRRIQQLLQSMTTEQPVLKSMDVDSKSRQTIESELPQAISKLRPISFDSSQSGVELSSSLNLSSINFGGALVKYVGKCRVSIASPGLLHLQEGEILLSAPKQTTIKVGSAHVQVKAGTIATIGVRDGLVKVRNIFEKKRTSVLAVVDGKRSIGVQVGQELIIGPQGIPLSKALSDDPVGRRHLSSLDLSSGHTCISSEVSLSSLLQNSAVLAQLLRSSGEQDRDLARRVMKMAVCVSIVTQSHGNYSMVNP